MNLLASTDIQPVEIAAADVSGAMTADLDLDEEMLVETTPEDGETPPDPEDEPEETDGPAYYLNDQNEKVYGTLEELLHSDADILYIETTRVIAISSSYASALAAKKLSPASYGYSFVNVSALSPETNVESSSSLFVWQAVSKPVTAEEAPVLNVLYSNLKESDWVNTAPTFTLTITPATGLFNTYSYAVRVDDGSLRLLGEAASNGASAQTATFAPATQGKHTYQFVLVNQSGEAVAESKAFTIWLDTDAPEFRVSNTATYAMVVSVEDYSSGGEYISLDGGKTWHKLTDKGSGASLYSATATQNTTFKAGSIVVRDKAGNTAKNQLDFTLYAMTAMGGLNAAGMSGFGGMSGSYRGGGSGRTVYHSKSDENDVIAYNALRLSVHDEGMTRLKIGDEQLDLELSRNSSPAADASQPSPTFTAEFAAWDGGESKDTLILTVNDDVTDENGYTWSFTGAVYKKLAASGIDYMLLRVGDTVTAISTSGFTAGIRYNMYRAEGLASKEFQYDVRMGILMPSFEMDCTVSGTTYAMSEDTQSEMYYYDVYTGTADQFRSLARTEG